MIINTSADLSRLIHKLDLEDNKEVQSYFTARCFAYMTQFTPGGVNSHLNREVELTTDEIDYFSPDAHYLYEGILYVDPLTHSSWARKGVTKIPTSRDIEYHTPGTGKHWDEMMWNSRGEEVAEDVAHFIDRRIS